MPVSSIVDARTESFAGKLVLVTGATSGIGAATARAFARRGAGLMIVGRDAARGAEVRRACAELGGEALFFAADVSQPDDVQRMFAFVLDNFGRIDIAFNNAGFQEPRTPFADQSDEIYERVFGTNTRALFYAMRGEIALMLKQGGGVIMNNASVSGIRNAYPGLSLYSAFKAAAISMTKSAAMEYAPHNIRINALSPGRILTPMLRASKIADIEVVAAGLPARRMGEPEDAAEAVLWLASDAAAFVIGHNLCVDGGFLAQ